MKENTITNHLRERMESCSIQRAPQIFYSSPYSSNPTKQISQFPISKPKFFYQNQTHSSSFFTPQFATLNKNPKGFGSSPSRKTTTKKPRKTDEKEEQEQEDEDDDEDLEGVIPEIVTNRMISRMGLSVGLPLMTGLLFFPFFYYLKVGLKIDVPTWVPFIVSFIFFGTALLGVSYGIVSSSWDPLREGSLLGWNEAKKNWPVFWQSIRGKSGNK